jgi:hypothetical protein
MEAQRQGEPRREANLVLHKRRAFERAPIHFSRRRHGGEGAHRALQKSLKRGERRLTVLTQRKVIIKLHPLKPDAGADALPSPHIRDDVRLHEKIADRIVIRSVLVPADVIELEVFGVALPPTVTTPTGLPTMNGGALTGASLVKK